MAKKAKTVYMCAECGNEFPSWQGLLLRRVELYC